VRTYFADLALVCQEVHPLLRRGGKAWIVVSTSGYAGVELPVDLIMGDVVSKSGWKLCGIYVLRELRAAGQYWSRLEGVWSRSSGVSPIAGAMTVHFVLESDSWVTLPDRARDETCPVPISPPDVLALQTSA
jgi:hypothetical protein